MSDSFRCSAGCKCSVETVTVELMLTDLTWMSPRRRSRPGIVTVYFRLLGLPMAGFTVDCTSTGSRLPPPSHSRYSPTPRSSRVRLRSTGNIDSEPSLPATTFDGLSHTPARSEQQRGWSSMCSVTSSAVPSHHAPGGLQTTVGLHQGRWCVFSACHRWLSHQLSHSPLFCAIVGGRGRRKATLRSGDISRSDMAIPLAFGAFPMQVVLEDLNKSRSDGRCSDSHVGCHDTGSVSVTDPQWTVSSRRGVAFLRAPSTQRRVARIRFTVRITCIPSVESARLDQKKMSVYESQCSNGGKRQCCCRKRSEHAPPLKIDVPANNNYHTAGRASSQCACMLNTSVRDTQRHLVDMSSVSAGNNGRAVSARYRNSIANRTDVGIVPNAAVGSTAVFADSAGGEGVYGTVGGCSLDDVLRGRGGDGLDDGLIDRGGGEGVYGTAGGAGLDDKLRDRGGGECVCRPVGGGGLDDGIKDRGVEVVFRPVGGGGLDNGIGARIGGDEGGCRVAAGDSSNVCSDDVHNATRPALRKECSCHYISGQCRLLSRGVNTQIPVVSDVSTETMPFRGDIVSSSLSDKAARSAMASCPQPDSNRPACGYRGGGDHGGGGGGGDGRGIRSSTNSPVQIPADRSRLSSAHQCQSLTNDWRVTPRVISGRPQRRDSNPSNRPHVSANSIRHAARVYDRMMHGLPARACRTAPIRRSCRLPHYRTRLSPVKIQLTRSAQLRLARYVPAVGRQTAATVDVVDSARDKHRAVVEMKRQAGWNRRSTVLQRSASLDLHVPSATRFLLPAQGAKESEEVTATIAPSSVNSVQSSPIAVSRRDVLTKHEVSDSLVERLSSALVRHLQISGHFSTGDTPGQSKSVATQFVGDSSKGTGVGKGGNRAIGGGRPRTLINDFDQISGQSKHKSSQGQITRSLDSRDDGMRSESKRKLVQGQMTRSLVSRDNDVYSENKRKSSQGQMTPLLVSRDDDIHSENKHKSSQGQMTRTSVSDADDAYLQSDFESDSDGRDTVDVTVPSANGNSSKLIATPPLSNTTSSHKPTHVTFQDGNARSAEIAKAIATPGRNGASRKIIEKAGGVSQVSQDSNRRKSLAELVEPTSLPLSDAMSVSQVDTSSHSQFDSDSRSSSRSRSAESVDSGTVTGNGSKSRSGSRGSTNSESVDSGTVTGSRIGSLERVESLTEEELDLDLVSNSVHSVFDDTMNGHRRGSNRVRSVSVEKESVGECYSVTDASFESDSVESLSTLTGSCSTGQRSPSRGHRASKSSDVTSESSELSARINRALRQADATPQCPVSSTDQPSPWLKNSTHHQRNAPTESIHTDSVSSYVPSMID